MKRSFNPLVVIFLMGIMFVSGWILGHRQGTFQSALEEAKVAAACLRAKDLELNAQFKEYLKGRIYYRIASRFPNDRGYLGREWDFGPVDQTVLKRRIYVKDPNFPAESFDSATEHLSRREPKAQ